MREQASTDKLELKPSGWLFSESGFICVHPWLKLPPLVAWSGWVNLCQTDLLSQAVAKIYANFSK